MQFEKFLSKTFSRIRNFSECGDFRSLFDENMYKATGLVKIADNGSAGQYYKKQDGNSDTEKYGYRLAFEWELENGLSGWEQEENTPKIQYECTLKSEEIAGTVAQISKKIDGKGQISKSDLEEVKDILKEMKEHLCRLHDAYPIQSRINPVKNNVQVQVLPSEDEKFEEYLLKISNEEQEDDILGLKEKLFVPVALQLAITYIHQEKEKLKKRGGNKFGVSDYLKIFQEEDLADFKLECEDNHVVKIVAAACNITLKKVREQGDLGIGALGIIEIMAYLDSDKVSVEEVFSELASSDKEKLWDSVELLEKYSLVNLKCGQSNVDKLVQEVIKLKLRGEDREKEVLKKVLQLKISIADASQANHIVSIWSCYTSKCDELRREFLVQFGKFFDKDRNNLLELLISNNQSQTAERILHDIKDDSILKGIINIVDKVGNTFLHFVAAGNVLDIVKYLVDEKGIDFNTKNIHRITPLYSAAYNNALDVVKYLIEKKNAVDLKNLDNGIVLLHGAAYNNALDVVKYLIEEKNVINFKNLYSCITLLHDVVYNNALDVVKYLIEEKNVVDLANLYNCRSLLNLAACNNALDVMKYLMNETRGSFNVSISDIMMFNFSAACNNAPGIIKYLMEEKNVIDLQNLRDGKLLLHTAAYNNALDVVKYLIDKGVDFSARNYSGENLLHFAVASNLLDVVNYLIEEKNAVDLKNQNDGKLLLHIAAYNNALGVVKYLIEDKNAVNLENQDIGMNILSFAVRNNSLDVAKYLIEDKNAVNLENQDIGMNILSFAADNNALGVVKYLIEDKKMVNPYNLDDCKAFLKLAADNNALDAVKYLIGKKIGFNTKDCSDKTLLRCAAISNMLDIVKYLIEDKKVVDFEKNPDNAATLLNLAIENDSLGVVKYLMDKKVDFSTTCDDGDTPLYKAIECDAIAVVKYLIDEKKEVDFNTEDCSDILDFAIMKNAIGVIKYLVNKKVVDFEENLEAGRDLLDSAIENDVLDMVKYLIEEREVVNLNNPDNSRKLLYDAIEYGTLNVVRHLIEGKVDLSTTYGCGKTFLDLAQKKLAGDQGNEDLKEIVNLLHSNIEDHLPEANDKINESPETDLSGIIVDNLQKRSPKL